MARRLQAVIIPRPKHDLHRGAGPRGVYNSKFERIESLAFCQGIYPLPSLGAA
jgi:hypothetical protein